MASKLAFVAYRLCALSLVLTACLAATAQESAPVVRLTVDYGDGVEKTFTSLAWRHKMTVFDALKAAETHPRGIRVSHRGQGEMTFVTAIDGVENEGAEQRNWRYRVNDQPAQYSAAVMELKRGDAVVWRYAK